MILSRLCKFVLSDLSRGWNGRIFLGFSCVLGVTFFSAYFFHPESIEQRRLKAVFRIANDCEIPDVLPIDRCIGGIPTPYLILGMDRDNKPRTPASEARYLRSLDPKSGRLTVWEGGARVDKSGEPPTTLSALYAESGEYVINDPATPLSIRSIILVSWGQFIGSETTDWERYLVDEPDKRWRVASTKESRYSMRVWVFDTESHQLLCCSDKVAGTIVARSLDGGYSFDSDAVMNWADGHRE